VGHGDHKAASADERDRDGRWLDLDPAVVPPHIDGHSGLQAGLATDVPRDNQSPRRIHGCFHAINSTTSSGRRPVINVGTGRETSLLDVRSCIEEIARRPLPYSLAPARSSEIQRSCVEVARLRDALGVTCSTSEAALSITSSIGRATCPNRTWMARLMSSIARLMFSRRARVVASSSTWSRHASSAVSIAITSPPVASTCTRGAGAVRSSTSTGRYVSVTAVTTISYWLARLSG